MESSPRNDLTNQGARANALIAGDASKWTSILGMPVEWNAVATSPQLTWTVGFSPSPKSNDLTSGRPKP
jgi:hypothetical protein